MKKTILLLVRLRHALTIPAVLKNASFKTLGLCGLAVCCVAAFSSCGTIAGAISKGKRPAFILNAPSDIVIKKDGKVLDIELELFTSTESLGSTASTNYYTAAIKLPYKKSAVLEFSSVSLGKTATLEMKPRRYKGIFFLNLITFPIVGHIIDGVTHGNKVLGPQYIDVANVLNNVPVKDWQSQKKLKHMEKRRIKKKYK
jgi:hypothetical protein